MVHYNDEIKLKDVLIKVSEYKNVLLARKGKILLISVLCSVLSISIAFFFGESKYDAELTFVVESDNKNAGGFSSLVSQFGFDVGGSTFTTFSQQNILELLKSRGVVVSTLLQSAAVNGKNDLLIEHYININKIKESWIENKDFDGFSFHNKLTHIHDSITGNVWNNIIEDQLSIELLSDKANIINLSYISVNEDFAKQFVEILISEMSKMYIKHKTAQAEKNLDFLKARADSVFVELELAEEEFARVKDINQRIIKASGRLQELQLMRRVEVLNTMYLEIVKNLELSKLTLLNQIPIINVIDKPILPLKKDTPSKSLAAILGGLLGAFLTVCYFVLNKLFTDALATH